MGRLKVVKNPDCENAEELIEAIRKNGGYCLCAIEKTEDNKCICKAFREQKSGICGCGVWRKVEND